jgi:hypothetical protein
VDDARDAELARAERLHDLGELLHQLGGGLPVVSGALREAELAVEEVEERGVAEVEPQPLPVEVRERDKGSRLGTWVTHSGYVLGGPCVPWKVSGPVSERLEFVKRWQDGERVSDLCREFGISRKIGRMSGTKYSGSGRPALALRR